MRLQDIYDNAGDGVGGWNELNEMVQDGDVSFQELEELYNNAAVNIDGDVYGLDLKGFDRFYQSIDDLFDDDDDDDDNGGVQESATSQEADKSANDDNNNSNNNIDAKKDLIEFLEYLQSLNCDSDDGRVNVGERRPWGLDCSDKERDQILENVQALLDMDNNSNSNNLIAGGNASNNRIWSAKDLTQHILGTWDLKYTNSRTMIINKSLSGLGRSTSDLAFNLGLQMIMTGTYYAGKAEFLESFGTTGSDSDGNDSDDSDDGNDNTDTGTSSAVTMIQATVTGEWILETGTRVDYKTGRPSVSLRVEVETIAYGSANTKSTSGADQWDSLSPIKLVDVLYLDRELMVLRGYANKEALFVYTRQ